MQIMPGTASHLGLAMSDIHDPEKNISAAARYISELNGYFRNIPSAAERQLFVLASYNGGYFHVQDAMALARKNGKSPHRWRDVAYYILALEQPKYYNDPVVKHGICEARRQLIMSTASASVMHNIEECLMEELLSRGGVADLRLRHSVR